MLPIIIHQHLAVIALNKTIRPRTLLYEGVVVDKGYYFSTKELLLFNGCLYEVK
ncbi:MAG: hypothetical protein IPN94_09345 [Sphingobacteriales bacterium]|nr:hypothetical protein [Sphingobacteriales bacterium]MBP6665355.1 hypothetical protein [Chitinophagales bacterium]